MSDKKITSEDLESAAKVGAMTAIAGAGGMAIGAAVVGATAPITIPVIGMMAAIGAGKTLLERWINKGE